MDRLNQLSKYWNEKERAKLDQKVKQSVTGLPGEAAFT
jgi:hypothetical protein